MCREDKNVKQENLGGVDGMTALGRALDTIMFSEDYGHHLKLLSNSSEIAF